MKRKRVGAFVGVLLAAVALSAAPASAHNTIQFHGSDWAAVNVAHTVITLNDGECDDNYVNAEYRYRPYQTSPILTTSFVDLNGCSAGAPQRYETEILSYRVCERRPSGSIISCTAWRTT